MAKDLLDFSKFKKIFEDDKNTHLKHPQGHTIIVAHVALSPKLKKQIADLPMHPEKMMELAQDIMEHVPHKMAEGGEAKPFKGYNPEKHSRTGGLNDSYREKYNREHGSDLKRPVTGNPKPGSEAAGRKKSFCARMKGVKGPTSEGGELTPKGAALKRWNCHAHGGMIEDTDHDEECMHYAGGGNVEKPAVSRVDMHYKDVTKRIPQLTEAANKLSGGELSAAEYDALVNKHKPVEAYGFVPQPASREDAMRALNESKRKMYGKTSEMTAGEPADLRLDIPAYKEHGVWVNSVHRKDAPTVYSSVSSVNNAQMVPSAEKALRVAAGGPKAPFAVIRGEWNPMEEQEAVEKAQQYLKHKDWKQVGYDPERHGYFYDRETMQPIEGAEQVIQIGPLVLAKKPKYGKKEEQLFAKGGKAEKERIFGERGDPSNKEMRAKQVAAASELAQRRYGIPIVPSKGKIVNEETGERKQGSKSKSPKPDWRSGELESEQTSQAAIHELAHLEQLPPGMGLKVAQAYMDQGSARAGKLYKGAAKQIQEEIQPMAMENPLRRRAGLPAFGRPQNMSPIYGESSKVPLSWEHPPRVSADTGEEYATRVAGKKGQPLDLIAQSKNLSDQYYQRLKDVDEGIMKFKPETGWQESMSPDALINLRGQGRMAEAEQRLRNRGEERFADGGQVPQQPKNEEAFKRNARQFEKGFNAGEDIGQSFQNIKSALGFAEGGQVGMDAIKKERYYADQGFVEPMTEEEQANAPEDFGMDFTQPQPTVTEMPKPAEPDFAKMAAENPVNPWDQKFKQYRQEAETAVPYAARGLKPGMNSAQLDEWALNKTLQDKQAAEQQQKRAQMQQSRMDTYHQQLEKNNQAKMQALGIQTPDRGVAGTPTVGGAPAVVGEAPKAAPDLMGGAGPMTTPNQAASPSDVDLYGPSSPYMAGAREQIGGIYKQAEAEGKIARQRTEDYAQSIKDQDKVLTDLRNMMDQSATENSNIVDDYMNERIDPMSVWNDKSVPGQIASAIGLILGGIGGGLTRQENPAMKFLQFQIDKAVEGQKMRLGRYPTLLQNNLNKTNNMRQALEATRAQIGEITAKKIERAAAMYGDEFAQARAMQEAGKIRQSMVAGPMMRSNVLSMAVDPSMTGSRINSLINQTAGVMPEVANDIRERYVPSVEAVADKKLPEQEVRIIGGIDNFEKAARRLMEIKQQHPYTLFANLPTAAKKEIQSAMAALSVDLSSAHGVEMSAGHHDFLMDQLGKPMSFYESIVLGEPRMQAVLKDLRGRKETALSKGFRADRIPGLMQRGMLPSGESSAPKEIQRVKETSGFTPLKRR